MPDSDWWKRVVEQRDGKPADVPKPMTEAELAAMEEAFRYDAAADKNNSAYTDGLRLVAEVRRLRGLLNTASSYLVDQDAHCQGCDRAIIRADHAPDCPVGQIQAEFGNRGE